MTKPADLTDFEDEVSKAVGRRLLVDQILEQLEPGRRDALLAALADTGRYTAPVISRTVTRWGIELSDGSVRKWRERHGSKA